MADSGIRNTGLITRYLQIESSHDIHVDSKDHNPASFEVSMPNSMGSNGIRRVVAQTVSIPKMFYNVYAPNNTIMLWQRRTRIDQFIPGNNDRLWITAEAKWQSRTFTVPPGRYSSSSLATYLSDAMSPWVVWGRTYTNDDMENEVFTVQATYPNFTTWGYYGPDEGEPVPVPPEYMPQAYLTEGPGSHFFDVVGLGSAQFVESGTSYISPSFKWTKTVFGTAWPGTMDPSTADSISGSDLAKLSVIVPLFDTQLHDIQAYVDTTYAVPYINPANLEGPVWVNVVIHELGNNSTIDTETGKPLDVVSLVSMTDRVYQNAMYVTKEVKDCDAEAIQFNEDKSIRSFKVELQDMNGNVLTLPRNWPVFLRLQIIQREQ